MLTNYVSLQLNGEPINCMPGLSLKDLLVYLDFDLNNVIVEHNAKIVPTATFEAIFIASGDKIEVLTVVGGG